MAAKSFQCLIGISVGSDDEAASLAAEGVDGFQCLIGISVGSDGEGEAWIVHGADRVSMPDRH